MDQEQLISFKSLLTRDGNIETKGGESTSLLPVSGEVIIQKTSRIDEPSTYLPVLQECGYFDLSVENGPVDYSVFINNNINIYVDENNNILEPISVVDSINASDRKYSFSIDVSKWSEQFSHLLAKIIYFDTNLLKMVSSSQTISVEEDNIITLKIDIGSSIMGLGTLSLSFI